MRQITSAIEFARFVAAGATNTIVTLGLYFALGYILPYHLAYAIAYITGILLSYYLNSRWVFKTPLNWIGLLSFPLVYVVQFSANVFLLFLLVEILGWHEWLAPLVVIAISVPITFVMSRFILKRSDNLDQ
ncbi:MAG: GtrA family protein [Spirochaetales bacterium]|nr:GtrA family protein [Spirochaetales bacterium]